jgi:hypothetical protein
LVSPRRPAITDFDSIPRKVSVSTESTMEEHLETLLELLPDLGNLEIMRGAWS